MVMIIGIELLFFESDDLDTKLRTYLGNQQGSNYAYVVSHTRNQCHFSLEFRMSLSAPLWGVLVTLFSLRVFFFIIGSMRISSVPMIPLQDDSDTPPALLRESRSKKMKQKKKIIKKKKKKKKNYYEIMCVHES